MEGLRGRSVYAYAAITGMCFAATSDFMEIPERPPRALNPWRVAERMRPSVPETHLGTCVLDTNVQIFYKCEINLLSI